MPMSRTLDDIRILLALIDQGTGHYGIRKIFIQCIKNTRFVEFGLSVEDHKYSQIFIQKKLLNTNLKLRTKMTVAFYLF